MQNEGVSPLKAFFQNKWVRLVLVIDVIIIVAIIGVLIYNLTKNAIISFTIAPIDATITVNGNSSYSNGSFQFHPGTYEVVISHDNLDSKTFTIELQPNSNVAITTFLTEDGNLDFYELKDNYSSYLMLTRIASSSDNQTTDNDTSAEAFITRFQEAYSLYSSELPVTYSEYATDDRGRSYLANYISVRAKHDCSYTLCLEAVLFKEDDRPMVNKMLEEAGFNVEDYEIKYRIY